MKINILGYGQMAKQIAGIFYIGGHEVFIWNHRGIDENEVFRNIKLLRKSFKSNSNGNITFVDEISEFENNFTFESVIEDLNVKRSLHRILKPKITKGYFTNSSSYSPSEIGNDVGSLHFFNPVTMKIAEFFVPQNMCRDVINRVINYLKSIEFEIIEVKDNRGFIGNYILFSEIASVLKLVEKFNYDVKSINSIYKKLYDGRNIFSVIDLIGIDVVYKILINLREKDSQIYLPKCLEKALNKDILGKKNKTSIIAVLQGS